MDIKSKKFSGKTGVKAFVFILCVLCFLGSLAGAGFAVRAYSQTGFEGNPEDLLFKNSYLESEAFQREFEWKANEILYMLHEFKSEEYIKSGEFISKERMDRAIENLFYSLDSYGRDYYDPAVREDFIKDHPKEIQKLKDTMILDQLREFEQYKKRTAQIKGYTYYATDGTYSLTNIKEFNAENAVDANQFMNKPAYFIFQNDYLTKAPASETVDGLMMKNYDNILEDRLYNEYNPNLKIYFAFDENYLKAKEAYFASAKSELMTWLPVALVCGLLSLAALIFLIAVTGRKDEEGNRPYHPLDRIFTELQLIVIALPFVFGGAGFVFFLSEVINQQYVLSVILAGAIGIASAGIGLLFILSCIRNLKAGRFLKNSLIYKVVMALYNGIKSIYHGGRVMTKVVLIVLAICLLSATVVLAPVVAIIILILAPKWVRKYEEIKKGVEEVKNGNLTYKIPLGGEGELDHLAQGINQISQASNIAVQNELKNQRLKTELISNVSHDLKTPLTSIITYIDLLKKEGLDSVDAPKYLDILDEKSNRLQKLTEDLFDAAKASSGAIPVKFEQVDMLALINQGLGEMASRIESSGLDFKITANDDKYLVRADGQLLWRVVENLLTNVLKYALEGSRVYIDLYEQGSSNGKGPMVVLEIKNISKAPLNINADELMERFKRGDESRTTEGSGLGLAIAKDLIKLQDGWFEIKIDGDLFKAVVLLSKIN